MFTTYKWHEKDIFTTVYVNRQWGDGVISPISGPGSSIEYTKSLRSKLPDLLKKYNIKSIYDAPCGDMTWMSLLLKDYPLEKYIGADIVEPLIRDLRNQFNDYNYSFRINNICTDRFPDADLWICRDCLFHLTNENILKTLKNFVTSTIPYALITTHLNDSVASGKVFEKNVDCENGDFRMLNLRLDPYNFPEPIDYIEDNYEGFPKRILGLWSREQILNSLPKSY